MKQDVHKWYPDLENKVQITLVEAGKKLLSTFDAKLSDYTMKLFQTRKIDVRTGVSVKEVQRHHILLTDGSNIPFGLVHSQNKLADLLFQGVWSTGVTAIPFVETLPVSKDRSGRILVDEYLRVKEPRYPNVYVVGDCAAFEVNPLPPTAQAAEQQGKYVAKYLNAKAHGREMPPFRYEHR